MQKWLFALARGSGTARTPDAERCVLYAAQPTDALFAEQQGREPRPSKADGLLAVWTEGAEPPEVPDSHGYAVDPVVHWDDRDHAPSPLVVFFFFRRRPDLSPAAFARRYRDGHSVVARKHHPGLLRYVQNFVTARTPDAPVWDAIAELHFAGDEAFRKGFYRDAESPAVVAADTAEFVAPDSGFVVATRECG